MSARRTVRLMEAPLLCAVKNLREQCGLDENAARRAAMLAVGSYLAQSVGGPAKGLPGERLYELCLRTAQASPFAWDELDREVQAQIARTEAILLHQGWSP